MRRASLFLLLCAACTDEPGICIEKTRINSEAQQVCYEVDSPGVCPTLYTGDEAGELEFEFIAGKRCKNHRPFEFECVDGVWEDVESECGVWQVE